MRYVRKILDSPRIPWLAVRLRYRPSSQIVLETEYDNRASLSLYGSMGFIKDRRLYRFYLNGKDA
jgi:peptide alpha-N-acetyltransferase